MGVVIPQVVTEDRASGAQIIDGGLRFDKTKLNYLSWTPSSSGNRNNWTISFWMKRGKLDFSQRIFHNNSSNFFIRFGADVIQWGDGPSGSNGENTPADTLRDTSGWYHLVFSWDSSLGVYANAIYINGRLTQYVQTGVGNPSTSSGWNVGGQLHTIGANQTNTGRYYDGLLSNVYFIDGQTLGPEYFGYTDPLTNTWRPKKYGKGYSYVLENSYFSANDLRSNSNAVTSGVLTDGTLNYDQTFYGNNGANGAYLDFDVSMVPVGTTLYVRYWNAAEAAGQTITATCKQVDTGGSDISGTAVSQTWTQGQKWNDGSGYITQVIKAGTTKIRLLFSGNSNNSYGWGIGEVEVNMEGGVGKNGFYLPFDGSAPIGQDQSGRGNDWTPVNFGGSNTIEKATGALPILNTDGGGKVARPGVFGSEVSKYYTLTGSSNSSTGYVFENEGTKPTLSMIRGTTHTFDYTSATSHPLYLSSLSDGKHNAKAYSVSFDGTGDYLSLADSDDWNFGSGAFTVEGFAYFTGSASQQMIVGQWAGGGSQLGWAVMTSNNSSRFIRFLLSTTGSDVPVDLVSSTAFDLNKWNHFALTRSGNDFRLFIDGVLAASTTNSATLWNSTDVLTVGATSAGTQPFNGYISNLRVIKGTALYTENFTPPTITLTNVTNTVLLCCQDSDATTAVVSPGAITANGDAAATNTYNPFLYDTDGYFGVDTSTSNVTKMTVPHYAPDTLYYYCNVHSGMGNSISVTTDTKKADPYAWKNVLGLPLVGSKDDVSNQVNSGSTTKTITTVNAVASYTQSNFYGGSFYFDGSGDYLQTPDSTDFTMGSGDYTIEGWFYFNNLSATQRLFGQRASDASQLQFVAETNASGVIYYYFAIGDTNYQIEGNTLSTSQWNHIAIVRSGDIHTLYTNGVAVGLRTQSGSLDDRAQPFSIGRQGNYTSDTFNGYIQDLRIYKGVAKYTSNFIPASTDPDIVPDSPSGVSYSSNVALVPSTDGAVSFDGSGDYLSLANSGSDLTFGTGNFTVELFINPIGPNSGSYTGIISLYASSSESRFQVAYQSSVIQIYTDTGSWRSTGFAPTQNAWTHLAFVRDTSSNTLKMYANGIEQWSSSNTQDYNETITEVLVGRHPGQSTYLQGFISNLHIVKGTALYTSNFTPPSAPLTATENTKLLCCKSNSSATAFDVSPGTITAVNAVATNFNPFTTDIDAVRGQESGYCTWNPLEKAANMTLSNGNLDSSQSSGDQNTGGTIAVNSGKWYWEVAVVSHSGEHRVGVIKQQYVKSDSPFSHFLGGGSNGYSYASGGFKSNGNNNSATGYSTFTAGDLISVALDMDNGKVYFAKNGIWQEGGNPLAGTNAAYSSLSGYFVPAIYTPTAVLSANFGQKPFKFPPPEGFQPLTLANTPRPSIVRPDQYVGIVTYTGTITDTSSQTVTGLNFESDLVWIKRRDGTNSHQLVDSVRGTGKWLESSSSAIENSTNTNGVVTAINSNGFTLTGGSTNANLCCESGFTYVAWAWKAGGNSNTFNIDDVGYDTAEAAGLTAGTITPTGASVNTKSGFSIITYTGNSSSGATVSHGLNTTPGWFTIACRNTANYWDTWHSGYYVAGSKNYMRMNTTTEARYAADMFQTPTSSVVTLGTSSSMNGTNNTYVMYCWAEIPGFSKFGTYTGNSSTDGPVVITGFKPALVILKAYVAPSTTVTGWVIQDSERGSYNVINSKQLYANRNYLEGLRGDGSATNPQRLDIDFLSNGFKLRDIGNEINATGYSYIYAAWAEAPTFNLYGAQSNAR